MTTPTMTGSPVARRRQLAAALRRARADAGQGLEEAAAALECSPAKISRIETATVRVRVGDVRDLATHYGLPNVDELLDLARAARGRGWWDRYADMLPDAFTTLVGLEDEATDIWTWEPSVLPGLLQTAGYARAVMTANRGNPPDDVERGMALRMARQEILTRDPAPALWAVVDESALRRPAGGRGVWAGQLRALLAAPKHVTLQVLPFARGLAAEGCGGFTVLGFADPAEPKVAYVETLHDAELVDRPPVVAEYLARFDQLRAAALGVTGSARLIRRVLADHEQVGGS